MKVAATITNLSILLLFVVAVLLNEYSEALYYLSVQEDELLEWATFWGFMVAAAIYFSSAYRQFKAEQFKFDLQMSWFVFGTSAAIAGKQNSFTRLARIGSAIPTIGRSVMNRRAATILVYI